MLTYLRGSRPVPTLVGPVPRIALPSCDDWRLDAAAGLADPETVEHAWQRVELDGWTIVVSRTPPFAYTVGLTPSGWPELIVRMRDLPDEVAGALVCELKRKYDADERVPRDGDTVRVSRFAIRLAEVDERLVPRVCTVAHALYGGGPVRALEVVAGLADDGAAV